MFADTGNTTHRSRKNPEKTHWSGKTCYTIQEYAAINDRSRNDMIPLSGDIKDMTVPWLLQDLRTGKKTGTAVMTRDREIKKIFLQDGDVLFASSNLNEDRLGEFLLRTGKITEAQFAAASETVIKTGKKLG